MGTHFTGAADEELALDAFIKLMRAADSLTADLSRQVGQHGLTLGQFGVLEALLHRGSLSQCDLGAKLLRSGSNVTTIVDNLEKRALVRRTRRSGDRRVVDVSLTTKGRRIIVALFPDHARRIARHFAALPAGDQARLGAYCRTLGRRVSSTRTPDSDTGAGTP
jgi:MarR family 2-MHQ and catechol resistance regulon transcriptional repressor